MFAEEEAHLLVAEAATPLELATLVDRRVAGLPLEHVLGWAEFGGLRVLVEPEVFVPRRRTELLASEAVALARAVASRHGRPPVVVELCCGSGAVSAVLLAELDPIELYAADLDPTAVRCARRNLGERARVLRSDLYAKLPAPLRRPGGCVGGERAVRADRRACADAPGGSAARADPCVERRRGRVGRAAGSDLRRAHVAGG